MLRRIVIWGSAALVGGVVFITLPDSPDQMQVSICDAEVQEIISPVLADGDTVGYDTIRVACAELCYVVDGDTTTNSMAFYPVTEEQVRLGIGNDLYNKISPLMVDATQGSLDSLLLDCYDIASQIDLTSLGL